MNSIIKDHHTKVLNILHIASFTGNIGDTANHIGFYKQLKKNISANVEFDQLEIRKFYKNSGEMRFDSEFIKLVNKYDLLVIGGGGFFDLNWDYSNTGTTIDFSKQLINNLCIPVLINTMGYHEFAEVKNDNVIKFKNFLDCIVNNKNWFVSVRNDGSYNRMFNRYDCLMNGIVAAPDHGFFFDPKEHEKFGLQKDGYIWIGMNLTNDLFNSKFNGDIDIDTFNCLIGHFVNNILSKNNNFGIILFPHTPQDLVTIGKLMNIINEKSKRQQVVIAPYISKGTDAIEAIFDLYRLCSCVIGMRFHTNVCSIGMNTPTIGLAGHEQISSLYNELNLAERCVVINNKQFTKQLSEKLYESLENTDGIKKQYSKINSDLTNQRDEYYNKLKNWFFEKLPID